MLVIGLTGGIGSGKSAVALMLQELGADLIDADKVGHEAYQVNSEPWQAVVDAFGKGILGPDGDIDRKKLGSVVFSDPSELDRLNAIMHPRMASMVKNKIESLEENGSNVVVLEAAVLLEAGWDSLVDEVWTVTAPVDLVLERLNARNGMTYDEASRRIAAQMSVEDRLKSSQAEINNSGDMILLGNIVRELWENRVNTKVGKV
ncbi:MAG: dephospho-CoA kinase [Dehalococcoidia bacterium]|nr:dephospho-CoA kinase [Dehalococcoidia bacterium]|tara:strand:- start:6117 stop:6728 length:612 start_codon:yes stop_codon:yes gene_type:complete